MYDSNEYLIKILKLLELKKYLLMKSVKEWSQKAKSRTNPHYLIPHEAGNAPIERAQKGK